MGYNLFKNWYFLYAKPTSHEHLLERQIARLGERYRAQHLFPGLKHIADFALLDRKLIIEVDGASHEEPLQKKKDLLHTMGLLRLGWAVVRVSNTEVGSNPERALLRALALEEASRQTTVEGLQEALDRLHTSHPELLLLPAKKPRRPRAQKAKSAPRGRAKRSSAAKAKAKSNPAPSRKSQGKPTKVGRPVTQDVETDLPHFPDLDIQSR